MGETSVKLSKRNIMRDLGEKDETSRSWSINFNFSNPVHVARYLRVTGVFQAARGLVAKGGEVET